MKSVCQRRPPRYVPVSAVIIVVIGFCVGAPVDSADAWELPEGRAYEMVTPPYKGGYAIETGGGTTAASPDGERFVFLSLGAFAGAPDNTLMEDYVARRSEDGWVTYPSNPPPMNGRLPGLVPIYSPNLCKEIELTSAFAAALPGESQGTAAAMSSDMCAPTLSFTQLWPLPDGPATVPGCVEICEFIGASNDLSHTLFNEVLGGIYQLAGLGGPQVTEEGVMVVGERDGPRGTVLPPCPGPGNRRHNEYTVYLSNGLHAVSDGGNVIFTEHCQVLYVRINNASTFELAKGGLLGGASEDGSKAFFTSATGELTMAMIDVEPGEEAVAETVPISPGASASVITTSDDGSHVYFTSQAVLTGPNRQGLSPQAGLSNLYVYDSIARQTTFVATAEVLPVPSIGWNAQTTPDGRFFVFTTSAALTPDDTDTTPDVYRYDSKTGELVRVSIGENSYDDNGNNNLAGAKIAATLVGPLGHVGAGAVQTRRLGTRAISDDGSTIVFSSAEPLSSRALNGKENVYAWHNGRVGMISSGLSQTSDQDQVISTSGRDIFFVTSQNLLSQDSDGIPDVYDARIGGGFPEPAVPVGGCTGEACQGSPSVPSLLTPPASATFSGPGNANYGVGRPPKPPVKRGCVHKTQRHRVRRRAQRCAKAVRAVQKRAGDRSGQASRGGRGR